MMILLKIIRQIKAKREQRKKWENIKKVMMQMGSLKPLK